MAYLVAAYAVLWAVSFSLVFSMILRQRRLDSELQALRVIVEDEPDSERLRQESI
jgi:CcmD family protein